MLDRDQMAPSAGQQRDLQAEHMSYVTSLRPQRTRHHYAPQTRFHRCWADLCLFGFLEKMSVFHDEVEIEDFEYDEDTETYYFPCPCGDKFAITKVSDCRLTANS